MLNLLPKKHITLEQSLLGFGSQIISLIGNGKTVDNLWLVYSKSKHTFQHTFDDMIVALDFLYLVGAICMKDGAVICLN